MTSDQRSINSEFRSRSVAERVYSKFRILSTTPHTPFFTDN
ncbi:hypothetical protein [Chroococcidiopsis sp.]